MTTEASKVGTTPVTYAQLFERQSVASEVAFVLYDARLIE